ncbi:MAG: 30S ribosomal protein S1 [Parcubacteria group bacterium]|nr:30S ribosomal protein S1 [Parcubacteria group bacterium]|tara:strand:- start:758 stop:1903 length:1146 start_codon:yes stop_codon:yes gene_type:complete
MSKKDGLEESSNEQEPRSKKDSLMAALLTEVPASPEVGDLVEGPVVDIDKGRIYIDLHPFGTGIIYGREYLSARDILKNVNPGDTVAAKVSGIENPDGYIEVSLREARQALVWGEAEAAMKNKTALELAIKDANKGGLIVEWQGIQGFLPASQLSVDNYPRVPDGDKDKIFAELKQLVDKKLVLHVITADAKEQKLIFTEKGIDAEEKAEMVDKYRVGDAHDGEITGATDFGVFVKLEDGLEGLVHISEMDWALVEDPKSRYKVGEKVRVQVIEVKDSKVSLSIKALTEDPWTAASKKFKKGDKVKAVVIKYNKHGALASIEEGVAGLVHVSEFGGSEQLRDELRLGSLYPFTITLFDPVEHKMTLSFKDAPTTEEAPKEE